MHSLRLFTTNIETYLAMKKSILYIVFSCILFSASGQDYTNAIKGSLGYSWGLSFQKLITQEKGYAAKLNIENYGWQGSLIRIQYKPAFPASSSQWFYGIGYGTHLAYKTQINTRNLFVPFAPPNKHIGNFITAGVDAFLSLEYRFLKYPFIISADYQPNFEFFGPNFFRLNFKSIEMSAAFTF